MIRKRLRTSAALILATLASVPSPSGGAAAGDAIGLDDCRKIWNLAAGRSDLGREQSKGYVDDFAAVDDNGDGKINNAEFLAGCEKGLVHPFKRPQEG